MSAERAPVIYSCCTLRHPFMCATHHCNIISGCFCPSLNQADWGSGITKCQLCSGFGPDCDCSTPEGICRRIIYKDLTIHVVTDIKTKAKYLQVSSYITATSEDPCPPGGWSGRKWRLSEHMTKGEIVQTVFMACLAWEEHECREAFKYKSQPVFSPHYNIESLVKLCEQGQFEERSMR